jgi:hypothetical protein
MAGCGHWLPSFKATCATAGIVYVLVGGRILLQGAKESMGPFGVPPAVLDSPHYADAIRWVYLHMVVLGVLMLVVGFTAEGDRLKRWFARAMLAAHVVYTFLDARSSESVLGTGLYRGPASIVPAIICLIVLVLFAHASFCERARV